MEQIAIEKRLGISVKNWRTRLKIPQDDLARRAGFHRSYISDIERGSRNISLKSIEKLADALGISVPPTAEIIRKANRESRST